MDISKMVDRTVLDQYKDAMGEDGEDFVQELVQTFIDTSPAIFSEMEQAYQAFDFKTFRRSAHSLKSTSAVMGVMLLSQQFKALEDKGAVHDFTGVGDELPVIKKELGLAIDALRKLFLE